MPPIEIESGPRELAGSRSRGTSSPTRRGGGPKLAPAAPRSLGGRFRALEHSVWLPVLGKGLALLAGMLALAAVGASSLARGSGVAPPPGSALPPLHVGAAVASFAPAATGSARELDTPAAAPEPGDAGAPSAATTPDGKIILNQAGPDDLRHLPGIGPKRADAIVALRAKLGGRFKRVSDLLRVKGIGPKGLKKIEPHVVLDAPKTS
jgi:competence protein ComEA